MIIPKLITPGFYLPGYVIKTLLNYLRKVSNQRLDLEFIMGFQIIKIGFGIFQIPFTISDMNLNAMLHHCDDNLNNIINMGFMKIQSHAYTSDKSKYY